MSRYVVLGAGAVGASLAAQLSGAGQTALLVGRGDQIARVREHGLVYSVAGVTSTVHLDTADSPDAVTLTSDDVLVVATKTQDVEALSRDWAWQPVTAADGFAVAADLPVVALQNGIATERILACRFSRVVSGSLLTPARFTRLGEVVVGSPVVGVVTLGAFPAGSDATIEAIAADLRDAGYVVQVTDRVQRWKAAKLLHSVSNGLEVLGGDAGSIAELQRLITDETRAVLTAAGLEAADTVAERTEDVSGFTVAADSGIRPRQQSTWQSFERQASGTEVDYLNGEVVLLGTLFGVETPVNRALQVLLGVSAQRHERPGTHSVDDVRRILAARSGAGSSSPADHPVLIEPTDLHDLLDSGARPVILDVRWRLDRPDGRQEYLAGHVPGAVFVDLDRELAQHGAPEAGRHPLPDLHDLQRSARSWGINDGDTVVVYDDLKNLSSARAWWLLRWAGLADVRILNGSLRGWSDLYPLETGDAPHPVGDVTLSEGHLPTVDIETVATWPGEGILLDARAGDRYRGEHEPVDPRAGHIPGARNAPTTANVAPDGRFLPADELRDRFTSLGVGSGTPVAVYCGSGVTASHEFVALTLAGFEPTLYPGSWSQWANHPNRPVATGDGVHDGTSPRAAVVDA